MKSEILKISSGNNTLVLKKRFAKYPIEKIKPILEGGGSIHQKLAFTVVKLEYLKQGIDIIAVRIASEDIFRKGSDCAALCFGINERGLVELVVASPGTRDKNVDVSYKSAFFKRLLKIGKVEIDGQVIKWEDTLIDPPKLRFEKEIRDCEIRLRKLEKKALSRER